MMEHMDKEKVRQEFMGNIHVYISNVSIVWVTF
jgi:hypothetical protein